MDEPLEVMPGVTIPSAEIEWTFSPSGGPGGQHANRSSTRVEARYAISTSPSLDDNQRDRLERRHGHELRVVCDETRSQHRNRTIALDRLVAALREGLAPPPRRRRATRPSAGAKRRRREEKQRRKQTKELRKRPDW